MHGTTATANDQNQLFILQVIIFFSHFDFEQFQVFIFFIRPSSISTKLTTFEVFICISKNFPLPTELRAQNIMCSCVGVSSCVCSPELLFWQQ